MVKRKKYFVPPMKRQIFGDASGQTSALILTVCHIKKIQDNCNLYNPKIFEN